jgi:hypothetical protein
MTNHITDFAPFDDWDERLNQMAEGGEAERASFFAKLRRSMFLVPQSLEGNGLSLLSTQHGDPRGSRDNAETVYRGRAVGRM